MHTPCEMFSLSLKRKVYVERLFALGCTPSLGVRSSTTLYVCRCLEKGKSKTRLLRRHDLVEANPEHLFDEVNWD